MDPEKAAKMFGQWEEWRAEFVPLGYVPEEEIPQELEARKVFLQGHTKGGHALLIVQGCKHFVPQDQLQFKSNFLSPNLCPDSILISLLVGDHCPLRTV